MERLPEIDQPSVPLRAKTIPTFLTPPPTEVSKFGMVASHFVSETPFIVAGPSFVSFDDDRIAPVDSLTMNAAASRGRTSGTAIGSDPDAEVFCRSDTRAWAWIAGTNARRMNHGRFASVAFTSTNLVVQGDPPSLKSVPPSFQYAVELMSTWTFAASVGGIWTFLMEPTLGSPE